MLAKDQKKKKKKKTGEKKPSRRFGFKKINPPLENVEEEVA